MNKKVMQLFLGCKDAIEKNGYHEDYVAGLLKYAEYEFETDNDRTFGLEITDYAKQVVNEEIMKQTHGTFYDLDKYCLDKGVSFPIRDLYYKILLLESRNQYLDSYLIYLEKNRPYKDKFYLPKRKCFKKIGLVDGIQDILDDKLDVLSISLIPGSGKTTLAKFLMSAVMGWYPKEFNLFYSHSGDITRMFFDGTLDIITNEVDYCWKEIFPDVAIQSTNAKMEQINLDSYKPFPNLQCTSVGAKNAGKVRASFLLICDDLIGGIEEALNKNVLDKIWNIYSVDARQRKIPGAKEIHIATRWSVYDVIGRLQRLYEGNERCRFIAVPDIDEETGKSNFNYEVNGFDEQFFEDQQKVMDEISYRCLYKNQPVEREGLLYHEDELRRFLELPNREPDAILGVCDTKAKGSDFLVLPCLYQYDDDYYMVDTICTDSSDYGVQYGRMATLIVDNQMQQCEFESNAGGDRVAFEVDKLVKELGGACNITTKPTETNKETRIIVNADWIKKHILFKDKELIAPNSDYGVFMSWLLCYTVTGKNVHDDVPDCMANFCLYVTRKRAGASVDVIKNPFRGGW